MSAPAQAHATRPRSRALRSVPSVQVAVMIEKPVGEAIAAPRPWTARITIGPFSDWEGTAGERAFTRLPMTT